MPFFGEWIRLRFKKTPFLILCAFLFGLPTAQGKEKETHLIDTGPFSILAPKGWVYKESRGIDAFTGSFVGDGIELQFEYSEQGYAPTLTKSPEEYLEDRDWLSWEIFQDPDLIYVSGHEYERLMSDEKERNKTLVEFHKKPSKNDKALFAVFPDEKKFEVQVVQDPKDKDGKTYIAKVRYQGVSKAVTFTIPPEVLRSKVTLKETNHFIVKVLQPACKDGGGTGVYFRSKTSNLTFGMYTPQFLSGDKLAEVLKIFDSIRFKKFES